MFCFSDLYRALSSPTFRGLSLNAILMLVVCYPFTQAANAQLTPAAPADSPVFFKTASPGRVWPVSGEPDSALLAPSASTLWYNGDMATSALPNGVNFTNPVNSGIYSDFNVTEANGWTVSSVFSNNLMDVSITQANYEIRTGVTVGSGGTLVYSGTGAATQTPTGRTLGGFTEYTVRISGLNLFLPAGTYFLNVSPIGPGSGVSYNTNTTGVNSVGTPAGNNSNEFWRQGATYGSTAPIGNDFSNGVIGNPVVPCTAPATVYVDDNWAGIPVGDDPDGGGPATYIGCDSFATVQGGVNGVATGGTVLVAAGTYNEAQVLIQRSMNVTGSGSAATFINGGNTAIPAAGLVRIVTPLGDTGTVTFTGFTVTNPGLSPETGGTHVAMYARPLDAAATSRITNNHILGVNASDNGFYSIRNVGSIVFDNNTITNTGFNPVVIERAGGPTEVDNNTFSGNFSSAYFNFTYAATNVTAAQRVTNNTINGSTASAIAFVGAYPAAPPFTGTFTNVYIANNTITGLSAAKTGITLQNRATAGNGPTGVVQGAVVTGNIITGTGAAGSKGVVIDGFVTNASVTGNDIRNLDRGISGEIRNGHSATGTQVHYNHIVGNTGGFFWDAPDAADATNNWWGCNAGPGSPGCDPVTGTGAANVDFDPWIVLGISASPSSIIPGGTSTVTADMTGTSAPPLGTMTVPPVPVAFGATEGTIAPPASIITSGTATALFTSISNNDGTASATVDNQTVMTPIGVDAPDISIGDVTQSENSSGSTTFTFNVTRTGSTMFASTVDYMTQAGSATAGASCGSGADYISTSGTLTFGPADTSEDVMVTVCGDTLVEPNETFTVLLSNPGGADITDAEGLGTILNDTTPSVQFSAASYVQDEPQVAAITVTRTGDTTGTSTVTFTTSNGTATGGAACGAPGIDYVNTTGPVNFAPGETAQTVNVPLCADALFETTFETVNLTLSEPVGPTVLGSQNTAVLNVNDTASQHVNVTPITINQGSVAAPYPSTINVVGAPSVAGTIRVTLYDVQHNNPEDLDILLVAPNGQSMILMGSAGGSVAVGPNTTITFDDDASAVLPDSAAITTGKYEPTNWITPVPDFAAPAPPGPYQYPGTDVGGPVTLNSVFGAGPANGAWNLYIRDNPTPFAPLGTNQLAGGWGLQFLAPSAANASIGGRVTTAGGSGIRNAIVVLSGGNLTEPVRLQTGALGFYQFSDLAAGQTYFITISAKRFRFSQPTRVVSLQDDVTGFDFVANPQE